MAYPPNLEYLYENSGAGPKLRPAIVPSAALVVGDIRYWPFRAGSLPPLWYACTGDNYALTSVQGQALNGLPATFKSDWGIVVSGGTLINVPMAFSSDGFGYFVRAVDGTTRQVGTAAEQGDAMREMKGLAGIRAFSYKSTYTVKYYPIEPPFYMKQIIHANTQSHGDGDSNADEIQLGFDASLSGPTAAENRPKNIGMTPAIYLGV